MHLTLIAAMAENRVIGKDGKLPWNLPEDLAHFKKTTSGHAIIMGRKTYESIGRPLPNRRNIILSKHGIEGIEAYDDIQTCIATLEKEGVEKAFIIGGGAIYAAFLSAGLVDEILLTEVVGSYEWDALLPEFETNFKLKETQEFDTFTLRTYTL